MIKLSILIPTIIGREKFYDNLILSLQNQYFGNEVEICTEKDNRERPIGEKRNLLLQKANGEYVAFIDDDDDVSENYIKLLLEGINKDADCCSLRGIITTDGVDPRIFEHSLKYKDWRTNSDAADVKYERPPNHLNCIKSEIAKQFKFPETYHGEDHVWSMDLQKSGLLKTEHYINDVIYFYNYKSDK